MVGDQNPHVRMSLASSILKCVPVIPKDMWAGSIVGACTKLLQDTEADVRLALVSCFSAMGNTPEAKELAPRLIAVVIGLVSDAKWRIRQTVVEQIPSIVANLGKSADEMLDVCIRCLEDRVSTIRVAACKACCGLMEQNPVSWWETTLLPRVFSLQNQTNYLRRVTLAQFLIEAAAVAALDASTSQRLFLPVLVALASDRIANVRLNCAKAVIALRDAGKLPRAESDGIINRLQGDSDADVRTAAGKK